MSSRMNFDDTVSDKFEFQVGGKDFDLKYPTLDEMKPLESKFRKIIASKKSEEEKQAELGSLVIETSREFVVPVGHEEKLEDVLNRVPINVSRRLNTELVQRIFSGE